MALAGTMALLLPGLAAKRQAQAQEGGALGGEALHDGGDLLHVADGAFAAPQPTVEGGHGAGVAGVVVLQPGAEDRRVDRRQPGDAQAAARAVGADAGGLRGGYSRPMEESTGPASARSAAPEAWIDCKAFL